MFNEGTTTVIQTTRHATTARRHNAMKYARNLPVQTSLAGTKRCLKNVAIMPKHAVRFDGNQTEPSTHVAPFIRTAEPPAQNSMNANVRH
jgi:hypothetical protein